MADCIFWEWPQQYLPSHTVFVQYDFDIPPIERWGLFPPGESGQVCDFSGFDTLWLWRLGHKGDKLPPASLWTLVFGGLGHHCVIKVRATCQATWRGDRGVFWSITPDEFLGYSQHQPPATSEDTSKWLLPPHCPVIFSSWVLSVEATDITEQKQTAPLCLFWIPGPQNL